jgi:hypothetical protein
VELFGAGSLNALKATNAHCVKLYGCVFTADALLSATGSEIYAGVTEADAANVPTNIRLGQLWVALGGPQDWHGWGVGSPDAHVFFGGPVSNFSGYSASLASLQAAAQVSLDPLFRPNLQGLSGSIHLLGGAAGGVLAASMRVEFSANAPAIPFKTSPLDVIYALACERCEVSFDGDRALTAAAPLGLFGVFYLADCQTEIIGAVTAQTNLVGYSQYGGATQVYLESEDWNFQGDVANVGGYILNVIDQGAFEVRGAGGTWNMDMGYQGVPMILTNAELIQSTTTSFGIVAASTVGGEFSAFQVQKSKLDISSLTLIDATYDRTAFAAVLAELAILQMTVGRNVHTSVKDSVRFVVTDFVNGALDLEGGGLIVESSQGVYLGGLRIVNDYDAGALLCAGGNCNFGLVTLTSTAQPGTNGILQIGGYLTAGVTEIRADGEAIWVAGGVAQLITDQAPTLVESVSSHAIRVAGMGSLDYARAAFVGSSLTLQAALDGVNCANVGRANFENFASTLPTFLVGGDELVVGTGPLEQADYAIALPDINAALTSASGRSTISRNS